MTCMVCKLCHNEAILKIYLLFFKNSFIYDFNTLFFFCLVKRRYYRQVVIKKWEDVDNLESGRDRSSNRFCSGSLNTEANSWTTLKLPWSESITFLHIHCTWDYTAKLKMIFYLVYSVKPKRIFYLVYSVK